MHNDAINNTLRRSNKKLKHYKKEITVSEKRIFRI